MKANTTQIKLDRTKLLGFKLDPATPADKSANPVSSTPVGTKLGAKFGGKIGTKVGAKPGVKQAARL